MELRQFSAPKIELEQYSTHPATVARIMHDILTFQELRDKTVCDLGCGTGVWAIACARLGAAHVTGVDVDPDALRIARLNAATMVRGNIDFVCADVATGEFLTKKGKEPLFDIVVMNPPFGTKRKGIDMVFLQTALRMAGSTVISIHKTSTQKYIATKMKSWGVEAEVSLHPFYVLH